MRIPEFLRQRLPPARRLAWYPPFRAMRVQVLELSDDWRWARLQLPLAHNRNPGGGMFGGAMASLADPIAALACNRLFPGHQVWTRELILDFRHEARTDMELRFEFDGRLEDQIRGELRRRGRATPQFDYAYFDRSGRLCAAVRCRVAIRPLGYRPSTMHRSRQTDEPG
jgi:acyl-coenzyme A thioesterase PaaI-like protein